jgi:hypothetical protein
VTDGPGVEQQLLTGADARALASTVLARVADAQGTVGELVAQLEQAMAEITRIADHTADEIDRLSVLRMNAPLRLLAGPPPPGQEPGGIVLGLAAWDGTLFYDDELITAPLKEMFDAPAHADTAALRRYRYALSELFQQNSHLLSGQGPSYSESAAVFADPAVRLLELGVAEAWTARHLDEYIDALEIGAVAPGIKAERLPVSYPAYVPAVEELARRIGERAGLDPDQVLRKLNNVTPAAKAETAAIALLGASGLASVVPPAQQAEVTEAVVRAILAPLYVMATLDTTGSDENGIRAASAAAGGQAADAAEAQIHTTGTRFRRH